MKYILKGHGKFRYPLLISDKRAKALEKQGIKTFNSRKDALEYANNHKED